MKLVTDRTKLKDIAEAFADSFMNEDGIIRRCLNHEQALVYFYIALEEYMKAGTLYETSDNGEGYCVFYLKDKGIPWYRDVLLSLRYLFHINIYAVQKLIMIRNGWEDYVMLHMNTEDYVDVCLVAVRKEYQGKGYLRKVLADAFRLADQLNIPCILDTDSELKALKYQSCGMEIEKERVLASGLHMYTMIYRPKSDR